MLLITLTVDLSPFSVSFTFQSIVIIQYKEPDIYMFHFFKNTLAIYNKITLQTENNFQNTNIISLIEVLVKCCTSYFCILCWLSPGPYCLWFPCSLLWLQFGWYHTLSELSYFVFLWLTDRIFMYFWVDFLCHPEGRPSLPLAAPIINHVRFWRQYLLFTL